MAKRYTSFKSSYILRKRHQSTDLGTIIERDWPTTTGLSVLRFGPGRRIWYNSGNFVFTTSNVPTYHKKHKLTTETDIWNWDDCKTADDTVNIVKPNPNTKDLRDFAYYGSCAELVRATVDKIIMEFPGRLATTNFPFDVYNKKNDTYDKKGLEINNQFNIDLHHRMVTLGKYDNEFRFMSNSWSKYCLRRGEEGEFQNVIGYEISDWKGDIYCPQNDEGKKVIEVTFKTETESVRLDGYSMNNEIVYVYDQYEKLIIQPQEQYIIEYFNKLSGFEKMLLRQDTKPYYRNRFITPEEYNFRWHYVDRYYIWPSDDYCIDISSPTFTNFYNNLLKTAFVLDELWCDNLYRSMTHEAIKNFDWTYSRAYEEGEEQDNIDGGMRMQEIIRIFGRVFDDVKYYIDGVKNTMNVSYDGYRNMPNALLSDKVNLMGFDTISTIGEDYDIDTTICDPTSDESKGICSTFIWYPTRNCEDVYPDVCDNEFMRRLILSSKRIAQTKGTQEAIDMMMGMFGFGRNRFNPGPDDDYTIEELAYYTRKLMLYDECVDGTISNDSVCPPLENLGEDWTKDPDIDWTEIMSGTKGDLANEINYRKTIGYIYYNDPFSGIPMKKALIGHENIPYIVPYYDSRFVYDGDIYFQANGGWGKKCNEDETEYEYTETMSYLHVASTISSMLSLNPFTLDEGDIYYVTNLSDYTEYDENPPQYLSHYFMITNPAIACEFNSWLNVFMDGEGGIITDKTYVVGQGWDYEIYEAAYDKVLYLENIYSTNLGNNPHVGFGYYDDGETYLDYMEQPFKYSLDKGLIAEDSYRKLAEKYIFDDIRDNPVDDKIQIRTEWGNLEQEKWYINTKVITITLNNKKLSKNPMFIKYFLNVIMHYVGQVIPSTTILKLKGIL